MSSTKITTLDQLTDVNNEQCAVVFRNNIDVIFQYSEKDITSVLEKKDLDVVLNIRSALCEKVKESFPEFANRRFINRKAPHLAIQDIISMANGILRDSAIREMEKVFVAKTENDIDTELLLTDFDANDPASVATQIRLFASEIKRLKLQCNASVVQQPCRCKCVMAASGDTVPTAVASSSNTPEVSAPVATDPVNDTVIRVTMKPEESSDSGSSDGENDGSSFEVPRSSRKKRKQKGKQSSGANSLSENVPKRDMYIGNVNPKCNTQKIRRHIQSHGVNLPEKDIAQLHQGDDYASFRVSVPSAKYEMISKIWSKGIKVRPFSPSKGPQHAQGKSKARHGMANPKSNHHSTATRRFSSPQNSTDTFQAGYDQAMQDARHHFYRPAVSPSMSHASRHAFNSYHIPNGKRNPWQGNAAHSFYEAEWPRLPGEW